MAQMPTLLTKENIGSFLNSFDSFLTDCDGEYLIEVGNLLLNPYLE